MKELGQRSGLTGQPAHARPAGTGNVRVLKFRGYERAWRGDRNNALVRSFLAGLRTVEAVRETWIRPEDRHQRHERRRARVAMPDRRLRPRRQRARSHAERTPAARRILEGGQRDRADAGSVFCNISIGMVEVGSVEIDRGRSHRQSSSEWIGSRCENELGLSAGIMRSARTSTTNLVPASRHSARATWIAHLATVHPRTSNSPAVLHSCTL